MALKLNFLNIKEVYFIGIGGIGMSALARYFRERGARVSGYDRAASDLTRSLEARGIQVRLKPDPATLPPADLVVYTPAVADEHPELRHYRDAGAPVYKRAEVLQAITSESRAIAAAGAHGKTTVSTLTAHLLRSVGLDCSAFLGGIALNYDTNFLSGQSDLVVVEADEYDRSFLRLSPHLAAVTSVDADHLDIYKTAEAVVDTYAEFAAMTLAGGGRVILGPGAALLGARDAFKNHERVRTYTADGGPDADRDSDYDSGSKADYRARDIRVEDGSYVFNFSHPGGVMTDLRLRLGGRQNVENAAAALALVLSLLEVGEPAPKDWEAALRSGLAEFRGVRRRFEYTLRSPTLSIIDDYAHHPTALRAVIKSTRELHPDADITIVFQPHLYTRTRDFAREFSAALSLADRVRLLPIYAAREQPLPGVDSESLLQNLNLDSGDGAVVAKTELLASLSEIIEKTSRHKADKERVLIMAGAGDIADLIAPVARELKARLSGD